jgi:exopolyphosphatase/guanosine-5'-triphosphate,3'-diphosphate pyrophosphatase
MPKIYAVIDIGTLKVKLLIARVNSGVGIESLYSSSTLTCFGCDMVDGNIVDGYLDRTISELKRCQQQISKFGVNSYRVVSTHALRRAKNQIQVIERIRLETGLEVENISSEAEATLFFQAVLKDFPADHPYALVDMGGGSMQVIIGRRDRVEQMHLLPIGSATLHEKFTHNSLDERSFNTAEDIDRMKDYILERLLPVQPASGLPIIYGSTNVIDLM